MRLQVSEKNKSLLENIIIPIALFIMSFHDFNRGVDLTDAGFSLSGFLYFDKMPGITGIPMFWSNVLGFIFTRLPYGNTWIGCLFYCTFVIAISVVAAYFFCKKFLDYRIVAVAEVFAIIYCWNPNSVLYDYLSFLLFELAMIVLLRGIETETSKYYIIAGIVLGVNTFVRLPNAAEIAAIVLVWFAGWYRKRAFKQIAGQTGVCVLGYLIGLALSFVAIFIVYDYLDFVEAIEELLLESSTNVDYGIVFMLLRTIKAVAIYYDYVLYFLFVLVSGSILVFLSSKFLGKCGKLRNGINFAIAIVVFSITLIVYYVLAENENFFNSNWSDLSSVSGLCCVFLFWGVLVSLLNLFLICSLETKLLALLFLGMFYVMPLGSNNHVYLVIMSMFMLIPLVVYHTIVLEKYIGGLLHKRLYGEEIIKIPYRAVLYASLVIMTIQSFQFGANYAFHDENVSITVEDDNTLYGMKTSPEKAGIIRHMINFCEENDLKGKEAIFYCNGPGLAFTLQLEPALSSTWIDWYTTPAIQFEKEIDELREEKETPLIILSPRFSCYYEQEWDKLSAMGVDKEYMVVDEKWQILLEYMKDNSYLKCYENSWYVMYHVND